ncbi:hypothetical protein EYE40_14285 [Glaciihabitans arcticus]|uniref:SD-repeat containing protein B domain-containing protein n=1 Tax=Glaciihabitans arcticus TaxID=2668039 RepID=A0A4Q9GM33_9MICO|nr:SdrD B-like domain-containing protein [Glaciihabitans arcticus]TBN55378.1 hypothetical protein EYE40_14285 [Glaciihabitans arcticus]
MTRVRLIPLRRAVLIAVSALVTAGLLVTGMTPAAHAAAGDASLEVRVTTHTGTPFISGAVTAFPIGNGSRSLTPAVTATPVAGKPGSYLLAGLDGGSPYAIGVQVRPASATGAAAVVQYLGGALLPEAARPVTPAVGTGRLDFSLMAGSLSGKVLTNKGKGLAGVDVTLYKATSSRLVVAETVVSSKTGAYAFTSLEPGDYSVRYETARGARAWIATNQGGTPALNSYSVGSRYPVAFGKPVVLSQKLALGGTVTGLVRGSGSPLAGAKVQAYPIVGKPGAWTSVFTNAALVTTANSKGAFSLPGLASGYYALSIRPKSNQPFADPNPVPNISNYSTLKYVKVVAGKVTPAPAVQTTAIPSTATVTGSFTGSPATTGGTVSFGIVTDFAATARSTQIQANGTWSINLPVGRYQVRLRPTDTTSSQKYIATHTTYTVAAATPNAPMVLPMTVDTGLAFTTAPVIANASTTAVGTNHYVSVAVNHTAVTAVSQWYRDGIPIFGANDGAYVSRGSDVGAAITSRITVIDLEADGSRLTGTTPPVIVTAGAAITNNAAPTLGPVAASYLPGTRLVVSEGGWNQYQLNFVSQWMRDGVVIPGATSRSYTLAPADAGTTVSVRVSAQKLGHPSSAFIPAGSVNVGFHAAPVLKKAPAIVTVTKGLPVGDKRYTVSTGTWAPVPGVSYQWVANGTPIDGATTSSLLVQAGDHAGETIAVRVQASVPGGVVATSTVVARAGTVAPTGTGTAAVTLAGTTVTAAQNVLLDSVLTASAGSWTTLDTATTPTFAHVWQRLLPTGVWTAIPGATKANYTVTAADVARPLRVLVTVVAPGYPSVALPPIVAGIGSARQDLQSGAPTVAISNIPAPTVPVGTTSITWGAAGITQSYQWFSCTTPCEAYPNGYTAIAKATAAKFAPTAALAGKLLVVRVTASKPGYTARAVVSAPRQVSAARAITSTAPPAYGTGVTAGSATVRTAVSAVAGAWNIPGVVRSYVWQKCSAACTVAANWTQLATGAKYVPDATAFGTGGNKLRVVEVATKKGYTTARQASAVELTLIPSVEYPTSKPTFTRVGNVITVSPVTFAPAVAGKKVHYRWYVGGSWVDVDPSPYDNFVRSFTVLPAHAGKTISVDFWYDSGIPAYGESGGQFEEYAVRLTPGPQTPPTFSGSHVGEFLHITPAMFTLANGDAVQVYGTKYQWLSNNVAIKGQTGYDFKPSIAYLGKKISFRATATIAGYTPFSVTSAQTLITKGVVNSGFVNLAGTGTVGSTLTATPTGFLPGPTFTYTWYRNIGNSAVVIPKAVGKTYVITAADQDTSITVKVTATQAGFVDYPTTSYSIYVPQRQLTVTSTPAVGGTGVAGTPLTVSAPTFGALKPVVTYVWYRDGVPVWSARTPTFTPPAEFVGDTVHVQVSAILPGYSEWGWYHSGWTISQGAAPTAVGANAPKVSGTAAGCSVLSATPGIWTADGSTYTYQWHASVDGPIPGATANQFAVPSGAFAGQQLFVVVKATRSGLAAGTAQSLPTQPVPASTC